MAKYINIDFNQNNLSRPNIENLLNKVKSLKGVRLKDKIDFESTISDSLSASDSYTGNESGSSKNEAIAALVSLGYSPLEATKSVQQVHLEADASVEDYIKQALKQLTYL